jgi:hypothetical protein
MFLSRNIETQRRGQVAAARSTHVESMQYATHLRGGDLRGTMAYMERQCVVPSVAKNVMFLLDYSGSMGGSGNSLIKNCVAAMRTVFDDHINDDDAVALTLFNNQLHPKLGWTPKGGNEAAVHAAIASCTAPR